MRAGGEFRQQEVVSNAIARAIAKVWRFFVCDILKPSAEREQPVTGHVVGVRRLNLDFYEAGEVIMEDVVGTEVAHVAKVFDEEKYQEWLEDNGILVDDDDSRAEFEGQRRVDDVTDVV